jgi:hypothetical protein
MERATPLRTDAQPRMPEPVSTIPIREFTRRALGAFWILDGLLQLQPRMFQLAMLHNIMEPLIVGEPAWLAGTVSWAIHIMTPDVRIWNALIVVVQLLLGTLILFGRTPKVTRTGLWLSLLWVCTVWLFGEGLGGVLTGSATVVAGEPGAVVLYGWIAVTLLLPDRFWQFRRGFNVIRDAAAVFFGLAAVQQLVPVFWTPMGLASQFQSTLSVEPPYIQKTILWAVTVSFDHPVLVNLLLVLALGFVSWRLFQERPGRAAYIVAAVVMFLIWWCGQGFGAIFTGLSTDLNTMPLVALMMAPAWMDRYGSFRSDSYQTVRPAIGDRPVAF